MKKVNTRTLAGLGLMTAIVIVLQLVGGAIRFGTFSISLVLLPIVVGAALYGRGAGAWLEFVFGAAVILSGDASAFLAVNVFGTLVTCLLKGALAGLCAGAVYKLFEKTNTVLATALAAVGGAHSQHGSLSSRLQRVLPRHRQGLGRRRGSRKRRSIYVCGLRGNKFPYRACRQHRALPRHCQSRGRGKENKGINFNCIARSFFGRAV